MISVDVANRISVFLKNRQSRQQMLSFEEVINFQQLPTSLATALKHQAYGKVLQVHPLIDCLSMPDRRSYNDFVIRLCSQGITEVSLKWGDELLHPGSPATSMAFMKHGRLEYSQTVAAVDGADNPPKVSHVVGPGPYFSRNWACEMALWCDWLYRGHLSAKESAIALVVEAKAFHSIVAGNMGVFFELQAYAEAYTRRLLADLEDPEAAHSVNALWGQAQGPAAVAPRLVDEVFQLGVVEDDSPNRRNSLNSNSRFRRQISLMSSGGSLPETGFCRRLCFRYLRFFGRRHILGIMHACNGFFL